MSIKPAPQTQASIESNCITGVGFVQAHESQRMLILLDIEALMDGSGMGLVNTELH